MSEMQVVKISASVDDGPQQLLTAVSLVDVLGSRHILAAVLHALADGIDKATIQIEPRQNNR